MKPTSTNLISQLKVIEDDIESLANQKKNILGTISSKNKLKKKLKAELDKSKFEDDGDVIVSDHAIVRYLERIEGIDIEAIRKKIIGDGRINQAVKTLENGSFPSEDGTFTLRVRDKVVVTVIKNE